MSRRIRRRVPSEAEWEIELALRKRVEEAFGLARYDPRLIPSDRREWFVDFLVGGLSAVETLRTDGTLKRSDYVDAWRNFLSAAMADGIVAAILHIVRLAYDADGKEERRGSHFGAVLSMSVFPNDGIAEIMRDALAARDVEIWAEYPLWFSKGRDVKRAQAHCRAAAAQWLPVLDRSAGIDEALLTDPEPMVRICTAMRWTEAGLDAEPAALRALLAGASQPDWIWSVSKRFRGELDGPDLAIEHFIDHALRSTRARSLCERCLHEEERKIDEMSDGPARARLARARQALERSRRRLRTRDEPSEM
jgi:hypothetical protein